MTVSSKVYAVELNTIDDAKHESTDYKMCVKVDYKIIIAVSAFGRMCMQIPFLTTLLLKEME